MPNSQSRQRPGTRLPGYWLLAIWLLSASALGNGALVAVATNFMPTAERLQTAFSEQHPSELRLTSGSTGKLFAQIVNGAPYDLFLAADVERPAKLASQNLIVPGARKTYALGTLLLWSREPALLAKDAKAVLNQQQFRRLAIANPRLAPYGVAARQVLRELKLYERLSKTIVRGENVGQAFAMVASGNAELGFIAGSMAPDAAQGSRWQVPADLHDPIQQQAVLLRRAADNPVASAFYQFLSSEIAVAIICADGYRLDAGS